MCQTRMPRHNTESQIGLFRSDQSTSAAALSKLGPLAKALIGGGAGGGAYGALSGDPGDRTNAAIMGGTIGAGLGGAGVGVSRAIANRTAKRAGDRTIKGAATQDELRQAAKAQYDIADEAQGAVPAGVYGGFVGKLGAKLKAEGADALLHPKVERVMSLMVKDADTPRTLQDLQILRRQLGTAAKSDEADERRLGQIAIAGGKFRWRIGRRTQRGSPALGATAKVRDHRGCEILRRQLGTAAKSDGGEADERRLGQIAIDSLDDFVENSAGELGGALKEGRQLWARLRKSEIIEDAIERATSRAAGTEAGLRNEFSKLARNKKIMRGFSAEEQAAITAVYKGTASRNALRILGGLSLGEGQRRNVLSALAGGGLGVMAAGPGAGMVGMALPAAIGGVSQKLAEKATMRQAQLARAVAAGPRQVSPSAGMTPPPTQPRLPGPTQPRLPAPTRPSLDVFLEQGTTRRGRR